MELGYTGCISRTRARRQELPSCFVCVTERAQAVLGMAGRRSQRIVVLLKKDMVVSRPFNPGKAFITSRISGGRADDIDFAGTAGNERRVFPGRIAGLAGGKYH